MGKIAFVFPGQGTQYTGMGKDIYENNLVARDVFNQIEEVRPNTIKQCFESDISELSITENTQPCIFAVEMSLACALKSAGIEPDCLAGFSLGEVTALTFSNILSFNDGIKFICKRAEYMQSAIKKIDTGMIAVMKLDNKTVEDIAEKFTSVFPVNYNCPGQLVVAGDKSQLEDFSKAIDEKGGKSVLLKVSGGFHSPFMEEASNKILEELNNIKFNLPKYQVYSNYTSKVYTDDVKTLLAMQVKKPVLWENTINNMIDDGVDTFIEVGPGKVLSGLIKKINKEVNLYNVEDNITLKSVVDRLGTLNKEG